MYFFLSTHAFAAPDGTISLEIGEFPVFEDDFSAESLKIAVDSSVRYLESRPAWEKYFLCGKSYTGTELVDSMKEMESIILSKKSNVPIDRRIRERFDVCRSKGRDGTGEMLVTGYFEPVLHASMARESPYLFPLYEVPPDLVPYRNDEGRVSYGRQVGESIEPYWCRKEIEENGLLKGCELVYLSDPVERFILHVQGSGWVKFRDGTMKRVQYAGRNGREYRSIGKLLVDEGKLPLEQVSLDTIVDYLRKHPSERNRILHHNESYIFFKWGEGGARGSLGEELTPGRSVALDHEYFPPGIIGFLETEQPVFNESGEVKGWRPMKRFILNHDSGSAIEGSGRLDIFWGRGAQARKAAGEMKHSGRLYFLVRKNNLKD